MPAPDALVSKLARAYGLSGLIPVEDARVRRLLHDAAEDLAGGDAVEFWVSEGWIQGPEGPLGSPEDLTGELARDLEIAGVSGVKLPSDVSVDALATFVGHLRDGAGSGDGSHTARTLAHEMPEIGVEFSDEGPRARGPARSLDRLFATGLEDPAPEAEASAPEPEAPPAPPEAPAAQGELPTAEPEEPAALPEPEVPEPAEGLSEHADMAAPPESATEAAPSAAGAPARPSTPGEGITSAEPDEGSAPAPSGAEGPIPGSAEEDPEAPSPVDEAREPTPEELASEDSGPEVTAPEEPAPEEAAEAREGPSEAEPRATVEDAPTGADSGAAVEVGAEDAEEGAGLGALVTIYLRAASGDRESVAERIRSRAEALRQDGVFDELAAAVQDLAGAGIEEPGDGPALELAREILVPGAATRIALELGQLREEEEREAMIALVSGLGETMAAPISEALADAGDRWARRAYIEAMVALGSAVEEQVLGMIEDSRWFVVRNGVAILGRIGDDRSIEHLTSTLAHEDLRVRRETVLALAKLGGENAAALALGMIDDPESEVRAATAMALGELEVEKAVRPLRKRLEEEEEEDVQVQILRALGQLGDPGAVPEIEKRAVSSFFSRSPRPVRMAAYKALSEIGTPHAVKLLKKALDDKDTEVRVAVRGMLKNLEEEKEADARD